MDKKHVETVTMHVCAPDNEGMTPLDWARLNHDTKAVAYLTNCCHAFMERHKDATDMNSLVCQGVDYLEPIA